ncbi:MAG TPA: hypothetical protein VEZ11_07900, partial [Thermoanaerobaculia bacterium]|nr:hypothetical protein [Thermoanaerobaculia bacterium]
PHFELRHLSHRLAHLQDLPDDLVRLPVGRVAGDVEFVHLHGDPPFLLSRKIDREERHDA